MDSAGDDLFAVDEALRFYLGHTLEEAAALLGLDERTAYRDWAYARAWLRRELDRGA